jgi:hypothetical protein
MAPEPVGAKAFEHMRRAELHGEEVAVHDDLAGFGRP